MGKVRNERALICYVGVLILIIFSESEGEALVLQKFRHYIVSPESCGVVVKTAEIRSCHLSAIFVNLRIFEIPDTLYLSVDSMKASQNFSRA